MKLMSQSSDLANQSDIESVANSPTWKALEKHFDVISHSYMRNMFAEDPQRFE
jgi:hypothetical protein